MPKVYRKADPLTKMLTIRVSIDQWKKIEQLRKEDILIADYIRDCIDDLQLPKKAQGE
jgi:hypothetical protein